jgi:hypothetical protein
VADFGRSLDGNEKGAMELMNANAPTRGQVSEWTERAAVRHRIKSLASSIQVVAGNDPDNFRHKLYEATCDAMMSLWDEAVRQEREACAALCEAHGDSKVAKWSGTELETNAKADAWNAAHLATMIRARGVKT